MAGDDTLTTTDGVLKLAELGDGNDKLVLGAATTATIDGGLGSDTVFLSSGGDTLRLTGVEVVMASAPGGDGDDVITVTDNVTSNIDLGAGNDTLTFEIGGAVDNGTVNGGAGTDTVNVNVNASLTLTLDNDFTQVEVVNFVDQGDDGYGVSVTLDGDFDNENAILFDASESYDATTNPNGNTNGLDAGESLVFDASDYGANGANDQITVVGGAGDDTITTAELDVQRGLMTVDLRSGGIDTVIIANDDWNGEGLSNTAADVDLSIADTQTVNGITTPLSSSWTSYNTSLSHGVEIFGFTGGQGGDKLDVQYGDGSSTTGGIQEGYVLGTGNPINKASGTVIELDSSDYTISLDGTSFTLRDIAFDLSAGGQGDALVGLDDGNYTVVIYSSDDEEAADAYIFNIRVGGDDGLDFTISDAGGTNPQADNDMIEYVGVLRGVGADTLVGENFI